MRTTLLVSLVLCAPAAAQHFVVANRGAANVTVHRVADGARERTVPLPAGQATPEPMYVVQVGDEVLVGDRANDRVVRFAKDDWSVRGTIPAGDGVFHMWAGDHQLWVNNDGDRTSTVVDTRTMSVIDTVPMPQDLVQAGYRPHDVFVGKRFAWVSLLGGTGPSDWVVQFDQRTRDETARAAVGEDPHLWWDAWTHRLFVASQSGNEVAVLDGHSLRRLDTLAHPGAHGIYVPDWTRTLLVTDFTGMGSDDLTANRIGLFGLRTEDTIDTHAPGAHNIAATALGLRIAVTHSGAASRTVTLYRLRHAFLFFGHPRLERLGAVEADLNPFGLALVR